MNLKFYERSDALVAAFNEIQVGAPTDMIQMRFGDFLATLDFVRRDEAAKTRRKFKQSGKRRK